MRKQWWVVSLWLVGCGVDSAATVMSEPGDSELTESADELATSDAKVWWPLELGNEWVFESAQGGALRLEASYASGSIRYVTGLRQGVWFGYSPGAPNSLYLYNWDQGWVPMVRFGYAYTPWEVTYSNGPCDRFDAVRSATAVSVSTPAAAFSDVRKVRYDLRPDPTALCAPALVKEMSFAPGVGPVAITSGSGESFKLVYARVGNKTWPAAQPAVAEVSADQYQYTNLANTIACITEPCPSNHVTAKAKLSMTVTNRSSTARTWHFPSGQQYDFQLFEMNGRMVRAWSDGKAFIAALTTLTLQPNESRTFSGDIELEDREGKQLSGTLTVRGALLGQGPSRALSIETVVQ